MKPNKKNKIFKFLGAYNTEVDNYTSNHDAKIDLLRKEEAAKIKDLRKEAIKAQKRKRKELEQVDKKIAKNINKGRISINRIWGVGLSRTGTRSLSKALEILFYRTAHGIGYPDFLEYDAAVDLPVAARFIQLDQQYKNCKFILTIRDESEWYDSIRRHFAWRVEYNVITEKIRNIYSALFGRADFWNLNKQQLISGYKRHNEKVIEYFGNRPNDLLVINICAGEGWERLCPFLQERVPFERAFPSISGFS